MNEIPAYKIIKTSDGSHTLYVPHLDEHYHSVNGAIQESSHVFIDAGLRQIKKEYINILEIGFGTGLNTFLTLKEAELTRKYIRYFTLEKFPLGKNITDTLNYGKEIWPERNDLFRTIHEAVWDEEVEITPNFTLHKIQGDSNACTFPDNIDLIYFDAFAPEKQPEMWTPELFRKLYTCCSPEAVFVTYCAKGEVRRNLQDAGFIMERLPGPPGKRHMLRGRVSKM